MRAELFRASASVGHQHFQKALQVRARAAMHDQFRIVKQPAAALLQIVHQRILFVRIQRFVKSSRVEEARFACDQVAENQLLLPARAQRSNRAVPRDRKSTRLNSSHSSISYAVFCLKKKTNK